MSQVYHEFCKNCKSIILTIEQMQTTKLCDRCGKRHADTFPERFRKLGEKEIEDEY